MIELPELFAAIEARMTALPFAPIGSLAIFIEAVRASDLYQRLLTTLCGSAIAINEIENRIQILLDSAPAASAGVRSSNDFALALYILALDAVGRDCSLEIAMRIRDDRRFWWAHQVAREICVGVTRRTVNVLAIASVDENILETEDVLSVVTSVLSAFDAARDGVVELVLQGNSRLQSVGRARIVELAETTAFDVEDLTGQEIELGS
jgi:hypothetical protein